MVFISSPLPVTKTWLSAFMFYELSGYVVVFILHPGSEILQRLVNMGALLFVWKRGVGGLWFIVMTSQPCILQYIYYVCMLIWSHEELAWDSYCVFVSEVFTQFLAWHVVFLIARMHFMTDLHDSTPLCLVQTARAKVLLSPPCLVWYRYSSISLFSVIPVHFHFLVQRNTGTSYVFLCWSSQI